MKVLVADDEQIGLTVVKNIVAGLGHKVIEAADGATAWEKFQRERPRVVISDWLMPKVSGLEFCERIRGEPSTEYTYFILLTGNEGSSQNYGLAMRTGVDDFLTKPTKEYEIHGRLRVAERILGLTQRVENLETFVPICAYCKEIRRDDGEYEPVEAFINRKEKTQFSHGICPKCVKKASAKIKR